jgi:hypothetical protein
MIGSKTLQLNGDKRSLSELNVASCLTVTLDYITIAPNYLNSTMFAKDLRMLNAYA